MNLFARVIDLNTKSKDPYLYRKLSQCLSTNTLIKTLATITMIKLLKKAIPNLLQNFYLWWFLVVFSKYITGAKRGDFCFFLNGTRGDVDSNIRNVPVNVECDPRITCSQSFQRDQCFKDAPTMSLIRVRRIFSVLNI